MKYFMINPNNMHARYVSGVATMGERESDVHSHVRSLNAGDLTDGFRQRSRGIGRYTMITAHLTRGLGCAIFD